MTARTAGCIWFLSKYASSRESGFETRFFALARQMVKHGRRVVVVTSDSNRGANYPPTDAIETTEEIDGILVRRLKTLKYRRTASVRRVLSWFDFERRVLGMHRADLPRPDVIVASSLSLLSVLSGLWLRRQYGCKLIFEVRDIWPLTMTTEGKVPEWHPFTLFLAWVERLGYRRADLVLGTMPNLGEHVTNVVGPGVRTACVPFGVDPAVFDAPIQPDPRVESVVPPDRFVVGYAGSIGMSNALETIVSCVLALRDDPRFFFVFLGDGDAREHFVQRTRGCTNAAFVGKVERSKVAAWLARCDLLYFAVHPSPVWRYGLSLQKLIDYMVAAKPILGSYTGHLSMINEAECGHVVPAGDEAALLKALDTFASLTPAQRADMGQRGRRWLREHRQWHVLASDYERICDDLVSS